MLHDSGGACRGNYSHRLMTERGARPLDGYEISIFRNNDKARRVFASGEGPPVIIISEIPGITPEQVGLGDRLVAAGFRSVMPEIFGVSGQKMTSINVIARLGWAALSREFATFTLRSTSPVAHWLRALARDLGSERVGVVGMCLTGNIPLAMLKEECVTAPVLSQPSLPFNVGSSRARDLGVADEDVAIALERAENGLEILGFRFSHDYVCPAARFEHLSEVFGDAFIGIELDSSPGNPYGFSRSSHSVLTHEYVDEKNHPGHLAFECLVDFLHEHLRR